jgi:alpha-mannosidase
MDQWRQMGRWRDEAAWVRVRSQLRFAEWLAERTPSKPRWRACVERAARLLELADGSAPGTAVAAVEEALQPMAAAAKRHAVYCVGHAHIDMNWMWSWPETVGVTLDTLRTMLALMDEFPEFHFAQSQGSVYAIVRQFDPAMLARIAERVREGRWEVTASHWVENDANLSGAEPLARHLLQTRAYMQELFGLRPDDAVVNWAPDTFGHAATGPSYLVQGGVRHVYMHRPGGELQPVPEAFWWEGPDGARVLVRNDQRRGYNCLVEPGALLDAVFCMAKDTGLDFTLLVYGCGDHGGGPTRRDLLMMREMAAWPVFPALVPSTSRTFFERLEREGGGLRTIADELNFEFAGCYTAQTLIKRDNRLGEARMLDAEVVSALAQSLGVGTVPREPLDTNWRRVLFSHFHDILPGSGVRDTRMYCHGQFQDTMAFTSVATSQALRAIADAVATDRVCGTVETVPQPPALFVGEGFGSGSGASAAEGRLGVAHGHGLSPVRPFVVFNTTAAERAEVVEFTLWDREFPETAATFARKTFGAVLADGRAVYAQRMEAGNNWGHAFQRYAVPLVAPPFGYTTVAFREQLGDVAVPAEGARMLMPAHHCSYSRHERPVVGLENERLRVEFDPATGWVRSLVDKQAGCELLDPQIGMGLEYAVERSTGMSAWVVDSSGPAVRPAVVSVKSVAAGPLLSGVELTYRVESSTVRLTYRLAAGDARLRIAFDADWLERGSAEKGTPNLRLAIGTALTSPRAAYEIPFGWIGRDARDDLEVPALRWALLESDAQPAGLLVLNDCKHGHAVGGETLRINLIRSSFDPDKFPELGEHRAEFALDVVPKGVCKAVATAAAQAFTHPLLVVGTSLHGGSLAPENALIDVVARGVVVSCVKAADDGKGLVVRLHNTRAADVDAVIAFNRVLGVPARAQAVDLLERPVAGVGVSVRGSSVCLSVPARGIASCRVDLAAPLS